jgi:hypothetical protein
VSVGYLSCVRALHFDTEAVNLSETGAEKSQSYRVSKAPFLLMLLIVVCLAMLAVFANVQRFRRRDLEGAVVRLASLPTPQATEH